jgi:hypothetical protein
LREAEEQFARSAALLTGINTSGGDRGSIVMGRRRSSMGRRRSSMGMVHPAAAKPIQEEPPAR